MLSKEQIATLKEKLEHSKSLLEGELKNLHSETPPNMGGGIDHFDTEADQAEEFTTNVSIAQALKERLNDIEVALAKIVKNTYGICEKCGTEIDFALLSIDPESRLCRQCKMNG